MKMIKKLYLQALFIFGVMPAVAQPILKGIIRDAITGQSIPAASIRFDGNKIIIADNNGEFEISFQRKGEILHVSSVGYLNQDVTIRKISEPLLILLQPANYALNQIRITSWTNRNSESQLKEPQSVGILTFSDFRRTNNIFPEASFNLIPGVFMQSRTISGGQRIIIRGYGNNTNFNNQGIKMYLNNIPITDATGTTIMDDIDFTTIGKAEIFKGPQSSVYGAGIAGVVNLYTIRPEPGQTRIMEENTIGSYGLWRTNTRIESAGGTAALLFNYGHQQYQGFRAHSADRKDFANFNGDFYISSRQTLSTYFSYNHSYEELAGELDSAHLYARQRYSDPSYLNNNAHVDIESFRTGISNNFRISTHFSNLSTVFANGYTLDQPFAAGYNSGQVAGFGGRTGFSYESDSSRLIWLQGFMGGHFQKTIAFNKSYNLSNGMLGGMRGDLQTYASEASFYSEWRIHFPQDLLLTAGSSFNYLEYTIKDLLANSSNPTHKDQSGYKNFLPVWSPRISLLKMITSSISFYADVSSGYTPPSISTVVIPATGQVNTNLQPEKGIQYEVGNKGMVFHKNLSYQLAIFDLEVKDKVVAVQNAPGDIRYFNIGRQHNAGAEVSLSYMAIHDRGKMITLLRPFFTYSYSRFTYADFYNGKPDNGTDYSGNRVAGVSPQTLHIGVDLESRSGFYLYGTYEYIDRIPYTFDNLHYTKPYSLLGGKLGFRRILGKHLILDAFLGGDNLLQQTYFTFLFLSPTITSQADPHFIPGSYTATFYGGLKMGYRF